MLTRIKRGTPKKEVYAKYEEHMKRLQEMGITHHKELKEFEPMEASLVALELNPVKRRDSVEMTKKLIEVLADQKVITAKELYDTFGWADKPVMKRLNILIKHGLVHRQAKKYYMATPRLYAFIDKHMPKYF